MSWLVQRWRTQRTAIRSVNCRIQWIIRLLNAKGAVEVFSWQHVCFSVSWLPLKVELRSFGRDFSWLSTRICCLPKSSYAPECGLLLVRKLCCDISAQKSVLRLLQLPRPFVLLYPSQCLFKKRGTAASYQACNCPISICQKIVVAAALYACWLLVGVTYSHKSVSVQKSVQCVSPSYSQPE